MGNLKRSREVKEIYQRIAEIYREGKAGLKQDFRKAIEYYTKIDDKSSVEELIEIMNKAEQPLQTTDELDTKKLSHSDRKITFSNTSSII